MGYIGKVTDTAGNTHLVGSTLYGTCDTATATAAKVVTCPEYVEEVEGVTIHIHFTNGNITAACTLNVNNKGAHTCVGASDVPGTWEDDSVASFTLIKKNNVLYWYQNDLYWENTNTDTKVKQAATTTNGNYPLLFKNTTGTSEVTDQVRFGSDLNVQMTANPSTGRLNATSFNGVAMRTLSGGGFELSGTAGVITALKVPGGADYTLGAACEKGVDTSVSSSATNSNVPTSLAVYNAIQNAITGVAEYQGSVSAESSLLNQALTKGWYYIVAMPDAQTSSITIGGKTCEAGDMVWIRDSGTYTTSAGLGDHIDIIQSNIDTLTNPEITTIWNNAVPVS